MPSPTTAITAMPGAGGDVVDEPARELVAERVRAGCSTARSASDSGSVNPIELSDDAWKIVETDSRSRLDRGERPRRDAVHADHALAGDGDDRLAPHDRQRLDRIARQRAARRDFGARRFGIEERSDVQHDPRAGDRDERARVQHLGAVVRDFRRLAMVQLRDEPRVGHQPRIGGQDAGHVLPQHDARARPARGASSVAVRSEPPRPSVVTLPSGAWPMKPGTTGVDAARRAAGAAARRARRPVSARSGAAPPCCPSVTTIVGRIDVRRPAPRRGTARRRESSRTCRSPRATSMSLARGARCPSTATAPHRSRYSRAAASMRREQRAPCRPGRQQLLRDVAMAAQERRGGACGFVRLAGRGQRCAARAADRSRRRARRRRRRAGRDAGDERGGALESRRASASEAPPNFQTSRPPDARRAPPDTCVMNRSAAPAIRRGGSDHARRSLGARRRSRSAVRPEDSRGAAARPASAPRVVRDLELA